MIDAPHSKANQSDSLWLYNRDQDGDSLKQLRLSKVPTFEKAEGIAVATKLKHGGVLAQERWGVVGLIRLGVDVSDFASKGDFVWIIRFVDFGRTTQEAWVSSSTGNVKCDCPAEPTDRW